MYFIEVQVERRISGFEIYRIHHLEYLAIYWNNFNNLTFINEYKFIYLHPIMPRIKDQNKIHAIYEATLALVLKSGYAELNMAAVAKEADIATGTIYTYFKNKEALINQLFLFLKEEKVKLMFKKYNEKDSFYVSFQKLWLAYFKISLNEYHKMMFIEQYAYSSIITSQTRKKADALLLPMVSLLEQAQQEQLIKAVEPEIILSSITGAVLEIVRYYQSKGTKPSKTSIEQCFEMAWTSIRK